MVEQVLNSKLYQSENLTKEIKPNFQKAARMKHIGGKRETVCKAIVQNMAFVL